MKQFLTPSDLTKAPQEVRTKLVEFCKKNNIYTWKRTAEQLEKMEPDEFNLPLLSIGQLIDFLGWLDMQIYYIPKTGSRFAKENREKWCVQDGDYENAMHCYYGVELIDALWEAICKEKHDK